MLLSVHKQTKPIENTYRRTLGSAAGARHGHGAGGGVVFEVGGFEDVAAVGATEFGGTT